MTLLGPVISNLSKSSLVEERRNMYHDGVLKRKHAKVISPYLADV